MHRLNEGFDFVEISYVVVTQKKNDYDTIEFNSYEKLSNGEIIIINDEPFVIKNTKYPKGQINEYSGNEFACRAEDSIVYGFVALNETITTGVNYLLGNTFGAYYFPDLNTLTCTIEGEIWNCNDLFKYLNEEKGYSVLFDYRITDDYVYTTVSIIHESNLSETEVVLKSSDFSYEIELDSTQLATAIYPKLDEAGAINAWSEINISPGTNLRYRDEEGKETGDTIRADFNKDKGSYFMYILDYDSNDFGDYGYNYFINTDQQNVLKFKAIDVSETHFINIYLKMQEEFIKLVESSIKVKLEINENIDELNVGTVVVAHLDEPYNLLSKGEDVKVISTEIIEKKIDVIDENEQKISYTTSDDGISLKALINGNLQSVRNIITARG
jgi:hypothetical protein